MSLVAFCTAHVVPGIDFSNDPLLAGRHHSYVDTQISRLGGANFHELPINAPLAPVANNQRDGIHRQTVNRGRVAYEPNSLGGGCPFQAGAAKGFVSFPQPVQGSAGPSQASLNPSGGGRREAATSGPTEDKLRGKPEKFADHYTQATLFFESQTPVEQAHIVGGFRFELSKLTVPAIRERMLASLVNVSPALAAKVAEGLNIPLPAALPRALENPAPPEVTKSPTLSLTARPGAGGIASRKIALLAANGVAGASLLAAKQALLAASAVPWVIAPRIGPIATADGSALDADGSFENSAPVLFDAVILPDGAAGVAALGRLGHAMDFIANQYRHGKTLLALGAASTLFDKSGVNAELPGGGSDPGVLKAAAGGAPASLQAFMAAVAKHRHPERETDPPTV